jgi:DNA invertase Pin-like site-specific DNA recombinase
MLDHLRAGDVLLVTRLDRLARSTADLLHIAELLRERGAGLRSVAEPWADTTTPAGRMILTVFAGIADFERSLIVERTSNGRQAAKSRGVRFGPKPVLTSSQIAHARELSKSLLSIGPFSVSRSMSALSAMIVLALVSHSAIYTGTACKQGTTPLSRACCAT